MENKYAGFGIRFLARMLDIVILISPPMLFLYFASISIRNFSSALNILLWYAILFMFLGNLISILYFSWTTFKFGGTPAKLLLGLKVTNEHGKNLTFLKSVFRHTVGYWVSALFFGLGYFWIIRDKEKRQAWHDMVTGSYVVKKVKGSRLALALIVFLVLLVLNVSIAAAAVKNVTSNRSLKSEIEKVKILIQEATKLVPANQMELEIPSPPNTPEIAPKVLPQENDFPPTTDQSFFKTNSGKSFPQSEYGNYKRCLEIQEQRTSYLNSRSKELSSLINDHTAWVMERDRLNQEVKDYYDKAKADGTMTEEEADVYKMFMDEYSKAVDKVNDISSEITDFSSSSYNNAPSKDEWELTCQKYFIIFSK